MSGIDPKTDKQRRALHKGFELWAEQLNEAGYDQKTLIEELALEVPNTKESIKEIYRAIMTALFPDVTSTEQLTRSELQQVWETMDREISRHTGVHVEFPRYDDIKSYAQYREAGQ